MGEASPVVEDRLDFVEVCGLCSRHVPLADRPLRLGQPAGEAEDPEVESAVLAVAEKSGEEPSWP